MLQDLLKSAKADLVGTIIEQVGLGQSEAEDAVDVAGESAGKTLMEEVTSGNFDDIQGLFSDNDDEGVSLLDKIKGNVTDSLMSKLNLKGLAAKAVQAIVVPYLLKMLKEKMGDGMLGNLLGGALGGGSDNGGGMLGSLLGGGSSNDAGGLLGGLLGGDKKDDDKKDGGLLGGLF